MEIIQEFTENQFYLHAITLQLQEFVGVKLEPPNRDVLASSRNRERLALVYNEPMGKLLFQKYAESIGCFGLFLLEEAIEELLSLPKGKFRTRIAKKIFNRFFSETAKIPLGAGPKGSLAKLLKRAIDSEEKEDELGLQAFRALRNDMLRDIELDLFPHFVQSDLYARLVSIRELEKRPVTKADFNFIRVLGEGGFGKVFAVSKKDTKRAYACKLLDKFKIMERKREKLVMNERNVLTIVEHTFIVDLKYAFQDSNSLYLVMTLVTGGELQFHLKRLGRFPEDWIRFYAAELVLALEYLHERGIAYRDLKLENVLLDAAGHVCLIDLGLCAFVAEGSLLSDHCGTRSYMSPEQTYGSYSFPSDWWSLGVVILVQLCGLNPFYRKKSKQKISIGNSAGLLSSLTKRSLASPKNSKGEAKSKERSPKIPAFLPDMIPEAQEVLAPIPKKSTEEKEDRDDKDDDLKDDGHDVKKSKEKKIKREKLEAFFKDKITTLALPDKTSPALESLIRGLLTFDPSSRLGAKGAQEIKNHEFFSSIDWSKLEKRHVPPPFVPSASSVNAEFLEAAFGAQNEGRKKSDNRFDDFDFYRPNVLQHEIAEAVYSKKDIVGRN